MSAADAAVAPGRWWSWRARLRRRRRRLPCTRGRARACRHGCTCARGRGVWPPRRLLGAVMPWRSCRQRRRQSRPPRRRRRPPWRARAPGRALLDAGYSAVGCRPRSASHNAATHERPARGRVRLLRRLVNRNRARLGPAPQQRHDANWRTAPFLPPFLANFDPPASAMWPAWRRPCVQRYRSRRC